MLLRSASGHRPVPAVTRPAAPAIRLIQSFRNRLFGWLMTIADQIHHSLLKLSLDIGPEDDWLLDVETSDLPDSWI